MATNTILAKMAFQISANTAEFNKSIKQTNNNFQKFTTGIKGFIGGLGLAIGAKEAIGFAFEMSKLAGEAEGVKAAFDKLQESEKLMADLKKATSNTVSELDLMKRTVQAANFGISLQALPELLKFAAIRAQQTGQSVDYLVDSIVTGIGRKSALILDNLGISAVRLKEQFNGASLEAQSIGDVAQAVGRIATQELEKMGEFSINTSSKVQQLNATWENLKVTLGKRIESSGFIDFSNRFLNFLGLLAGGGEATMEALNGGLRALNYGKLEGKDFEKTLKAVTEIASELGVKLIRLKDAGTGYSKVIIDTRTAVKLGKEVNQGISEEEMERRKLAAAAAEELRIKKAIADINRRMTGRAEAATNDFGGPMNLDAAFKRLNERMSATAKGSRAITTKISQDFVDMGALVGGSVAGIAESLGQAFVDSRDFGKDMLKVVANFASQLGQALIAIGTGLLVAKKAISKPGLAIAAGVALVALAGALSASASRAQSNFNRGSSSSSSEGVGRAGGVITSDIGDRINLVGEFLVSGTNLKAVITNQNRVDGRTKF